MTSRRAVSVGGVAIGGGAPVVVQSMTCTPTADAAATLDQIRRLAGAGCELVRVSVPAADDVPGFAAIVASSPLPVIADIHFDWRLALEAIRAGAAGVRINPGTIGSREKVREIVRAAAGTQAEPPRSRSAKSRREAAGADAAPGAAAAGADSAPGPAGAASAATRPVAAPGPVAIRIGVNQGSLPRDLRPRAESDPAGALVEAALRHAADFEDWGFTAYKISVKSSSVPTTIAAYRELAERSAAPLHIGVTEAGTIWRGSITSAVGIGALLAGGIGDTLRVSLAGDPVEEVRVAWQILAALELRRRGPQVIACPTCARTEVDLTAVAEEVERRLAQAPPPLGRAPITVAVMGCRVNGPEEARHADFGIAAGRGEGVIFAAGERVATVPEDELVEALLGEIGRRLEARP